MGLAVGGRLGWGFTGPMAIDGKRPVGVLDLVAVVCIRGGRDTSPMGSSGTLLPPYPERLGGGGIPQLGFKTALAAVRIRVLSGHVSIGYQW